MEKVGGESRVGSRSVDFPTYRFLASRLPGYNGIDIPLGDKPHNPLASVGHLQSSVSSRPRPVHFPRLRVAASRSDSKYLDNLGHRPLLYRSIDRSVHPSIHHRGNIGIIFLFSRKRRAKKKRKRRSLSLVRSDLSDIRALNLFLSLSGVEREREREVAERRATRPRERERDTGQKKTESSKGEIRAGADPSPLSPSISLSLSPSRGLGQRRLYSRCSRGDLPRDCSRPLILERGEARRGEAKGKIGSEKRRSGSGSGREGGRGNEARHGRWQIASAN